MSRTRPTPYWASTPSCSGSSSCFTSTGCALLVLHLRYIYRACAAGACQVSVGQLQVFKQKFWMRHWGHPNPKHSIMWGTTPLIRVLHLGQLIGSQRRSTYKCAKAYVDKQGRRRFQGTKDLKRSGLLGCASCKSCSMVHACMVYVYSCMSAAPKCLPGPFRPEDGGDYGS